MTRQKKESLHEFNYAALLGLTDSVVFSLMGHCHGDSLKKFQLTLESVVPKARSIDSSHGMENGHDWDELVFSFFLVFVFEQQALALLLHIMRVGFALLLQDLFLEM